MKKILITNDDGIDAESLYLLKDALSEFADCIIVAPDSQRSASGHAVSLGGYIQAEKVYKNGEFIGYKVSGTPVDCVKLALCALVDEKPDLIVSGVNIGPNTGISVIYSGTVGAAREGTISGIPSVAASMCSFDHAGSR